MKSHLVLTVLFEVADEVCFGFEFPVQLMRHMRAFLGKYSVDKDRGVETP